MICPDPQVCEGRPSQAGLLPRIRGLRAGEVSAPPNKHPWRVSLSTQRSLKNFCTQICSFDYSDILTTMTLNRGCRNDGLGFEWVKSTQAELVFFECLLHNRHVLHSGSVSMKTERAWVNGSTSNLPGLESRSSLLLESSCQALALREEGIPFLQRNFTWNTHIHLCYTHIQCM